MFRKSACAACASLADPVLTVFCSVASTCVFVASSLMTVWMKVFETEPEEMPESERRVAVSALLSFSALGCPNSPL